MDFIHQVEPYITDLEAKALTSYLQSGGWLTEFKKTEEFEKSLAEFLGVRYAVTVTSGTVGLYLALLAAGIRPGDKVIVPNYTMIATINAVKWTGAEPVIVDIDPVHLCTDLMTVKLDRSCKAFIYVSINGRSGNMNEVVNFSRRNNLLLVEDACQSLGSLWNNQCLGTFGDIGVFSFTPHKIITTGQGGLIVSNDEGIYKRVKKLKDFDRVAPASDWHEGIGYNFKFTDLQSVVGLEQLKIISFRINKKKEIFKRYQDLLKDISSIKFLPTDLTQTTPWFIDILLPSQVVCDQLMVFLKQHSIGSRPFYPPINHQKPYSDYPKGSFPISESVAYCGLWLPSSIGLADNKIDYICQTIRKFVQESYGGS